MLYVRQQRDRQPRDIPRLRDELAPWVGSWLHAAVPGFGGKGVAVNAGGTPVSITQGVQAYAGDSSDNIVYAPTPRPFVLTVDTDFTLVVVFKRPTGGTDTGCIGGLGATSGSGGNTLFRLIGGATTAGAVQYQVQDSSGTLLYNTESSSGGVNDAQMHCAVVALNTAIGGTLEYYIDGVARGSVSRAAAPGGVTSTTFNSVDACASRRGGSTISASNFDVALVLPLVGVKMSPEWCLRTSRLSDVWGQLFEPRRVWVPVSAGGAGFTLDADLGTYTITGSANEFLYDRVLNNESGTYSLTGNDASTLFDRYSSLDSGTYGITGADATLTYSIVLEADSGTYVVFGQDATFLLDQLLAAEAGSYSLTGSDATLDLSGGITTLNAESGSYLITGNDVTFSYSGGQVTIKAGSWIRYRVI